MEKTNINPAILQEFLECAVNAREKGQSQFFTPLDFARTAATPLPNYRPVICDLNCGAGHLLYGTTNSTTRFLLGADIDPVRSRPKELETLKQSPDLKFERITRCITRLYTRLHERDVRLPLVVLNPPWSLYLRKEHLGDLARSEVPAVARAMRARDDAAPRDSIESQVLMLALALDRLTASGEGLLIGNNNTFERKLFAPGAPFAELGRHVWARWVFPGNPMTGLDHANFERELAEDGTKQFATGVLYFAREHTTGPTIFPADRPPDRAYRQGAEVRSRLNVDDAAIYEAWLDVREQCKIDADASRNVTPWNLWLNAGGVICTHLSRFEQHSRKTNKDEAKRLFELQGKRPMQLVMQRAQRDELLHVARDAGWKVQPELLEAVDACLREYHASRAPLYPLPEIQRLGHCDEVDFMECRLDFSLRPRTSAHCTNEKCKREVIDFTAPQAGAKCKKCDGPLEFTEHPVPPGSGVLFRAGQSYPLRTQTVSVERTVWKPNSTTGALEELEYNGQDLAMFLTGEDGWEYCFMDGNLRSRNTKVGIAKALSRDSCKEPHPTKDRSIDATLQDLVAHFVIPEVPDVAQCHPERYHEKLQMMNDLETLTETLNQELQAA